MIDSHCHLTDPFLFKQLPEIFSRSNKAQITKILTIGCEKKDWISVIDILNKYPFCYGAIGLHPDEIKTSFKKEDFYPYLAHPKIIGIGEAGLDFFYNSDTKKEQINLFEKQIELAQEINLPLIVHTRESEEETISILEKHLIKKRFDILFHCFTGCEKLTSFGIENNFYFSASGIITFKKAEELRNLFKKIPLSHLLIETDAPYLAPIPHRGEKNEPSFLVETAKALSQTKGIELQSLVKELDNNFYRLFKKA